MVRPLNENTSSLRGRRKMPYSFTGDIVLRFTGSVNRYFPKESFRGIMAEDLIGMDAGDFVRVIDHSVFILGRRGRRRAFRRVCMELRLSPHRAPCPLTHGIRIAVQPCIHGGLLAACFRYGLPARRLRKPRARLDGVFPSSSYRDHLRRLYARHRGLLGSASTSSIAAQQPSCFSGALAEYRQSPLLHRGSGDDGLYGGIPFPRQHPPMEPLVYCRLVRVLLSFIGCIRRTAHRLVHARPIPFVARDQAAPGMPCGLPCCRGGILGPIRQRGFSKPFGGCIPQPLGGTRYAGRCERRCDWPGNRATHYARNLLDYPKGMPYHTCLGLRLLARRVMLALLPHCMRSPLIEVSYLIHGLRRFYPARSKR